MRMKLAQYVVILVTAALVAGCGSDKGDGVAPSGSTIQILPTEINYQPYLGTQVTPAPTITLGPDFVTVTVLNSSGHPVRGASVIMFHRDGDSTNSIVSSNKNGDFLALQPEPYVGETDDFGSVYLYLFTTPSNVAGESAAVFEAFTGNAFTEMTVTMTCLDENTATENVCD